MYVHCDVTKRCKHLLCQCQYVTFKLLFSTFHIFIGAFTVVLHDLALICPIGICKILIPAEYRLFLVPVRLDRLRLQLQHSEHPEFAEVTTLLQQ
jgi:hypothetical protein